MLFNGNCAYLPRVKWLGCNVHHCHLLPRLKTGRVIAVLHGTDRITTFLQQYWETTKEVLKKVT
jgi:hypothetical protein